MENIFFDLKKLKSCGKNVIIGKTVRIRNPELVEIGNNVIIDDFTYISGHISIGNYVHIAASCSLQASKSKIILADLSFHNKIILNCGNPILYKLSEFINHMLELNFTDNNNKLKSIFIGWENKYLKQHKELKDFIIKGNPLKAKNKMISIISANRL